LPSIASADCHCQSTPPSSSHSATSTAQIFSKMPPWTHRWNQSWTVLLGPYRSGIFSHWQPLRIRKMIPLSIFLQLATLRPVALPGQNSLRMGSMRRQSSSGISQIVGNGLVEDLVRAMAIAPRGMLRGELSRSNLLQAKGVPVVLG
jgi:hypothetical protein